MKKFTFNGPAGPVEIKEPLPLRMISSSWFLVTWTLVLILWAGDYLSFRRPQVFLGNSLSPGHRYLVRQKAACFTCHTPFSPVTTDACLDCHKNFIKAAIHNSMSCKSCHPMHTNGDFIPHTKTDAQCDQCHNQPQPKPRDGDTAAPAWEWRPVKDKLPSVSHVPYTIFPHSLHSGPGATKAGKKKFACYQCHYIGPRTMDTPMEKLFKMESCIDCKYHQDKAPGCKSCHNFRQKNFAFHLPKDPPRVRDCVGEIELIRMKANLVRENIPAAAEPGWKNLKVCETGEPAIDHGKLPSPETPPPYPEPAPDKPPAP
jgi:hypothetical protein